MCHPGLLADCLPPNYTIALLVACGTAQLKAFPSLPMCGCRTACAYSLSQPTRRAATLLVGHQGLLVKNHARGIGELMFCALPSACCNRWGLIALMRAPAAGCICSGLQSCGNHATNSKEPLASNNENCTSIQNPEHVPKPQTHYLHLPSADQHLFCPESEISDNNWSPTRNYWLANARGPWGPKR